MDSRFVQLLTPYLPLLRNQELTEDVRLRDFGLDSMKSIDLLFNIEDTFEVSLPDEDLNDRTFTTAGNLWKAVSAALAVRVSA